MGEKKQLTTLQECYQLTIITAPLFVESAAYVGQQLVASSYVGHLPQPVDLSAYVLAQSVSNISGYSIVSGLTGALETFAGQAYGAGNHHMLGVLLVRAQLVCLVAILPIAVTWASGSLAKLLLLVGQQAVISNLCSRLLQLMVPSLLLSVISETVGKYLVSQSAALPGMACHVIGLALAPLCYGGLIRGVGLGLLGAALGALAVEVVLLMLQLGYLLYRETSCFVASGGGASVGNWHGFTWAETLQGWGNYLQYGLPLVVMVCVEWWASEALVLMAGLLKDAEVAVAVMGISFQAALLPWMFFASVGTATTTRVAQVLGAGNAKQACSIYRLACWVVLVSSLFLTAGVWWLRRVVISMFTGDATTQHQLTAVLPAVIVGFIFDGQVAVLNGLFCACGRQGLGAAITTGSYVCLAMPAGWMLGFKAGLGVWGLRAGLTVAVAIQALVLHALVLCWFDWQDEVTRARRRVEQDEGIQTCDTPCIHSGHQPLTRQGDDNALLIPPAHHQQPEEVELAAVGSQQCVAESMQCDLENAADKPDAEFAPLLCRQQGSSVAQ